MFAEILVFVRQAFGQPGLSKHDAVRCALETELVSVQVVAVLDGPVDFNSIAGVRRDIAVDVFGALRFVVLGNGVGGHGE